MLVPPVVGGVSVNPQVLPMGSVLPVRPSRVRQLWAPAGGVGLVPTVGVPGRVGSQLKVQAVVFQPELRVVSVLSATKEKLVFAPLACFEKKDSGSVRTACCPDPPVQVSEATPLALVSRLLLVPSEDLYRLKVVVSELLVGVDWVA